MNVLFSPEALDDLREAVDYIAARNPAAAERLVDRIFALIDRVASRELEGPEVRLRSGEIVRSWPVNPLRFYYQRQAESFVVLRVYHQARAPLSD